MAGKSMFMSGATVFKVLMEASYILPPSVKNLKNALSCLLTPSILQVQQTPEIVNQHHVVSEMQSWGIWSRVFMQHSESKSMILSINQ